MGEAYRLDWAIAMIWSGEMDLLEVLSIFREIGDQFWITNVLWVIVHGPVSEGDLLLAKQYLEESLACTAKLAIQKAKVLSLLVLGRVRILTRKTKPVAIEMLDKVPNRVSEAGNLENDYI